MKCPYIKNIGLWPCLPVSTPLPCIAAKSCSVKVILPDMSMRTHVLGLALYRHLLPGLFSPEQMCNDNNIERINMLTQRTIQHFQASSLSACGTRLFLAKLGCFWHLKVGNSDVQACVVGQLPKLTVPTKSQHVYMSGLFDHLSYLRVPVTVVDDDCISSSEGDALSTSPSGQQEHKAVSFACRYT